MVVHISLDLETWGKRAGFDARSIGACHFDLETGVIYDTFYVACDNPRVYISGNPDNDDSYGLKYDLKRDDETIAWWSRQPEEAQAAFNDPVDLKVCLQLLTDYIVTKAKSFTKEGQATDVCIWSHGAAFDPPIVDGLFIATNLPIPWFYRAPRDTRTAFDFAEIDDHTEWLKKHNSGTLHHALYDSISQARAISMAKSRIRIVT